MATAVLLLLRAVARRDARKLLNHNAPSVLAHGWRNPNLPVNEAAAAVGRGYSTLVREVEGFDRSWRFWDLGLRRGFSLKSAVEQEQGKVEVAKVEETVVKVVKRVGRPRKAADSNGVEKVKPPRRKPKATMKKLEEEIAANEAASGSAPVKLKLTRKKSKKVEVLAGVDSAVSSVDDSVGVATISGSEEEVRCPDSSALIDSLKLEAVGESSNAILSSLVEDGEPHLDVRKLQKDSPPAPRFPKLDLTSKQRIISVELDGDDKGNERGAKVVVPAKYSDPQKVFQMLQHARPGAYTSAEKARLSWIFHRFAESGLVRHLSIKFHGN